MHIAVIGTGYVGLVTGACFAEFGVDVTCVDVDEDKIARLLRGVMPIYEPGLEQLVLKNTQAGRLRFTTDVKQAIEQALVIFLAVGTPPKPDGSPDRSPAMTDYDRSRYTFAGSKTRSSRNSSVTAPSPPSGTAR